MDANGVRPLRAGANQAVLRAFNERLILTLIQRHGFMAGADIAKRTELSAQTVSNILRKLEGEGFLRRGSPMRGRVGKPSVPLTLDPNGALSVGMKLGRRSADLAIMDLDGRILAQSQLGYTCLQPSEIFDYLKSGICDLSKSLSEQQQGRLCGIGIAAPSEVWKGLAPSGATQNVDAWREVDVPAEVAKFSPLPVYTVNDATAACRAEHTFGRGREFRDYAYLFIGSYIGGGVVLNSTIFEGGQKNAGAFGALRLTGLDGQEQSLVETASIYLLESQIVAAGKDPSKLWRIPQDWSQFSTELEPWLNRSARKIAAAARAACSVIDFEAILIDGAFPMAVRSELVKRTRDAARKLDFKGVIPPRFEAAAVGANARVIGAASAPINAQFFLN